MVVPPSSAKNQQNGYAPAQLAQLLLVFCIIVVPCGPFLQCQLGTVLRIAKRWWRKCLRRRTWVKVHGFLLQGSTWAWGKSHLFMTTLQDLAIIIKQHNYVHPNCPTCGGILHAKMCGHKFAMTLWSSCQDVAGFTSMIGTFHGMGDHVWPLSRWSHEITKLVVQGSTRSQEPMIHLCTLWLFNIAVENVPFIDGYKELPMNKSDYSSSLRSIASVLPDKTALLCVSSKPWTSGDDGVFHLCHLASWWWSPQGPRGQSMVAMSHEPRMPRIQIIQPGRSSSPVSSIAFGFSGGFAIAATAATRGLFSKPVC